jgi:membrane protease subunit (stomatin/prohibitin family)
MGIINWMRGQFIDIIEWLDDSNNTLVWRFPRHNNEIKNGAKLIVREGQVAIFVDQGKFADQFGPGTYTLTTENLPILSTLKGWKYGFESPYKAEVYFVNTRQYLDMKWGTLNPIMLRDADFGIVRVRAFGIYAIQVDTTKVKSFLTEVVGTDGEFNTQEIEGHLRRMLVSAFTGTLGKAKIPALDLAGNYDEIGKKCSTDMAPQFSDYGLLLRKFLIENISLPPEVEKAIDTRSSMGAIGNMQTFGQFQAAHAMREAANNPGGMAGVAAGAGAGLGIGHMMGSMMGGFMQPPQQGYAQQPQQAAPPPAAPAQPSVGDRLKKLKDLQSQGLIDDATFAAKRDAILAEI